MSDAASCVPLFCLRHMLDCLYCLQSVLPLVMSRSTCRWGLPLYLEGQITDKIHLKKAALPAGVRLRKDGSPSRRDSKEGVGVKFG